MAAEPELDQDLAERWQRLSGIPVEAVFLRAFRDAGAALTLGFPISPGVFVGDTLTQYFTHGRLESTGRSALWPMGVPRQAELGELLAKALAVSGLATAAPVSSGVFQAALATPDLRAHAGAVVGQPLNWRGIATQLYQRDVVRLMPLSPGMSRPVRGNLGELYASLLDEERAAGDGHPSRLSRAAPDDVAPVDAPILTYHTTRGADRFRDQLMGLLDEGLVPVSFDQLVAAIEGWSVLPPRAFVVTFDDGWAIQVAEALPTLVELRVPAIFFVMPGFDRHRQGHQTLDQFREVRAAGMTIASHTLNHARLPGLIKANLGAARAEVVISRATLEREVDGVDYFAYPNGLFDDDTVRLVIDSGYRAAVTTRVGIRHSLGRRFELRRVPTTAWASFSDTRDAIRRAAAADRVESPI